MLTAQAVTQKWLTNMGRASEAYKQGIQAVTESPTAKAAQAQDRWLMGVQRAMETGRFANSLNRISLPQWQAAAINKGAARLATGAAAAQDKMTAAMTQLLPYIQQGVQQLPPRGDLQANIARSVQMQTYMAQYKNRM